MINWFDAKLANLAYEKDIQDAVRQVLDSGCYLSGEQLFAFEQSLAAHCNTVHAIGVGNGTEAITLMLRAAIQSGVLEPGDGVIVPANSFVASAMGVSSAGLVPEFADVNPRTLNLDCGSIESALTSRTRAVLSVHLFGRICDMSSITAVCREHGLALFEDAAQALGASWNGKPAGSHGIAAAFSFYPTKNLGAVGSAGAITTDDPTLAEAARKLGNYGGIDKYKKEFVGQNSRLDEIQAAVLNLKLRDVAKAGQRRREISAIYDQALRNIGLRLPSRPKDQRSHSWHLYVVRCRQRDLLMKFLKDQEIHCGVHYPLCIHQQPAYRDNKALCLPHAELAAGEILSLPMYAALPDAHMQAVIENVQRFFEECDFDQG